MTRTYFLAALIPLSLMGHVCLAAEDSAAKKVEMRSGQAHNMENLLHLPTGTRYADIIREFGQPDVVVIPGNIIEYHIADGRKIGLMFSGENALHNLWVIPPEAPSIRRQNQPSGAPAPAATPDRPGGVGACISFKGDTAVLTPAAQKSLDNLARFVRETPQDLQQVAVGSGYLVKHGNLYSYFLTADVALARAQTTYRAFSARAGKEFAHAPVYVNAAGETTFTVPHCETGVFVSYKPPIGGSHSCDSSHHPFCDFVWCDEKGCFRQSSETHPKQ